MTSTHLIRDLNRRVVLDQIRKRQPISRADLARITGMQRCTISQIVGQLMDERWVLEGATGRLPLGRRPTLLRLNDQSVIVGVDVRSSRVVAGVADLTGRFLAQETIALSPDPQTAIDQIVHQIQEVASIPEGTDVLGVGISLPGRWNREGTGVSRSPKRDWPAAADIRTPVMQATGLDVVELENTANASLLGAVLFDGVDVCSTAVAVCVAEEIDVGILANGQLLRGLDGMAGEFGHVSLDPNGPPCECGGFGCWAMLASNLAALRCYFGPGALPNGLNFVDLLNLADRGDSRAGDAVGTMAHYLGRGIRMIVASLAPERILMIGDLAGSWPRFGPEIEREIADQLPAKARVPQLIPIHDARMALRGAVALVIQKEFDRCRRDSVQPGGRAGENAPAVNPEPQPDEVSVGVEIQAADK